MAYGAVVLRITALLDLVLDRTRSGTSSRKPARAPGRPSSC